MEDPKKDRFAVLHTWQRLTAYQRKYYSKHRNEILSQKKEYRNRPEIKEKRAEAARAYRQKNKDRLREYYRLWYKKNSRTRAVNYAEPIREWEQNNPEKVAIYKQFSGAVRSGKIKPPDLCSKCAKERRLQSHHYDYKDYRHFIWVCASCHKLIHLGEKH